MSQIFIEGLPNVNTKNCPRSQEGGVLWLAWYKSFVHCDAPIFDTDWVTSLDSWLEYVEASSTIQPWKASIKVSYPALTWINKTDCDECIFVTVTIKEPCSVSVWWANQSLVISIDSNEYNVTPNATAQWVNDIPENSILLFSRDGDSNLVDERCFFNEVFEEKKNSCTYIAWENLPWANTQFNKTAVFIDPVDWRVYETDCDPNNNNINWTDRRKFCGIATWPVSAWNEVSVQQSWIVSWFDRRTSWWPFAPWTILTLHNSWAYFWALSDQIDWQKCPVGKMICDEKFMLYPSAWFLIEKDIFWRLCDLEDVQTPTLTCDLIQLCRSYSQGWTNIINESINVNYNLDNTARCIEATVWFSINPQFGADDNFAKWKQVWYRCWDSWEQMWCRLQSSSDWDFLDSDTIPATWIIAAWDEYTPAWNINNQYSVSISNVTSTQITFDIDLNDVSWYDDFDVYIVAKVT